MDFDNRILKAKVMTKVGNSEFLVNHPLSSRLCQPRGGVWRSPTCREAEPDRGDWGEAGRAGQWEPGNADRTQCHTQILMMKIQ